MDGAQKHGKVCTAVLDLVMILVLILPGMSILIVNVLAGIAIIVMLSSLALYLKMYWKVWKSIAGGNQKKEIENVSEKEKEDKKKQEANIQEREEGNRRRKAGEVVCGKSY